MLTNLEHRISYDSTGRLISKEVLDLSVTGNLDKWLRSLEYNYDLNNNVSHFAYADRNVSFITAYTYGKDNLLEKTILKDATIVDSNPDDNKDDRDIVSLSYSYDNLGRLTGKNLNTTNVIATTYTYHDSKRDDEVVDGVTKNYTTTKLATEETANFGFMYEYDAFGNITEIYEGVKNADGVYEYDSDDMPLYWYFYDKNNQLVKVRDGKAGLQTEYTYDSSGNITSKEVRGWDQESGSVTGSPTTISYAYTDSTWKDLLTSYNGQALEYDAIGNPLTYRDGITLTWQICRKLASYAQNGTTVNYTYDVSCMRTSKTQFKT